MYIHVLLCTYNKYMCSIKFHQEQNHRNKKNESINNIGMMTRN